MVNRHPDPIDLSGRIHCRDRLRVNRSYLCDKNLARAAPVLAAGIAKTAVESGRLKRHVARVLTAQESGHQVSGRHDLAASLVSVDRVQRRVLVRRSVMRVAV